MKARTKDAEDAARQRRNQSHTSLNAETQRKRTLRASLQRLCVKASQPARIIPKPADREPSRFAARPYGRNCARVYSGLLWRWRLLRSGRGGGPSVVRKGAGWGKR